MAQILSGIEVAKSITGILEDEAASLNRQGIKPMLAILRAGNAADQISYEKSASKRCEAAGIGVSYITLPEQVSQSDIILKINELNNDKDIHGVLILRPLPAHINDAAVRSELLPSKDVDGITDISLAGIFTGKNAGFPPCTAKACMEILDYYKINPAGKHAAVLGRSLVVGKPAALMLIEKNATVTVCHSKSTDIKSITRSADIIIAATGRPESLDASYFRPGQTIIDVGINWNEKKGKLCGDVSFEEAGPVVAAITPVPGGVGSVTTAVLAAHVVKAAELVLSS